MTRRRAVRREHVRHARLPQVMRARNDAGQVPAGVQVRDVESRACVAQKASEAARQKELPVVGEPVRDVREQPANRATPATPRVDHRGSTRRRAASQASVVQTVTWWPRAPGRA